VVVVVSPMAVRGEREEEGRRRRRR